MRPKKSVHRNVKGSPHSAPLATFPSTWNVSAVFKTLLGLAGLAVVTAALLSEPSGAQTLPLSTENPMYTADGQLIRPKDYREWIYVTSGLGMTYGPAKGKKGTPPMFDNVFVKREAHQEFLRSGTWPDKTIFILELRRSYENVSINKGGRTQGEVAAIEAAVKDQQRFPNGGWGYFTFDSPQGPVDTVAPLPTTESCYSCHEKNTAVEHTFVQFYPTLFEVAKRFDTIKPTYDPTRKP
jgi:hypothetical protein